MTKFIYPTLDLFLYDLREGLGQTEENVEENRRLFKQKLVKINDEDFDRRDKQYLEPEYVELLGEQRYNRFDSEIHEGYDYPVRLGDTYGLLLDCSCKEEQEAVDLQWLRDLKVQINERLKGKSGTIGQTWMFSAQLPSVPTQEYEKLAKQCYEALIPGANSVDKMGKSDFLGGCLFEFWQYTSPELSSAENPHLIMIFYPNEKAAKDASLLYHDWMFLLMYRHKMMWAYNQSRLLKKDLKREAVKIQACNKEVSENSNIPLNFKALQETLRKAWDVLPRYTTELSYLDDQSRTLEINQDNYQKGLESLEEKIGEKGLPLAKFGETMRDKYLRQVKRDHANLSPGLKLLAHLIEYIQTMVAIEEEKRERAFQDTIATWGIGLATGAIVASVAGQFPFASDKTWLVPVMSIGISFVAAVVAGLVTKGVIRLGRR